MNRPRRFTVDEALRLMMEENDDDFFGVESCQVGDGSDSDEESDNDSGGQGPSGGGVGAACGDGGGDTDDDDDAGEYPLDRVVDPGSAAARYCGLLQEKSSGNEGSASASAEDSGERASPTGALPRRVCGCQSNCLKNFDPAELEESILNMRDMEKSERDLIILGILESLRHSKERTTKGTKRTRERFAYKFQGSRVCVSAFRIVYDLGKKHLVNLITHLEENGAVPRVHGNTGKRPHNTLSFTDVKNVTTFIDNHAVEFGIPHPAPLHGRADMPPIFLPASQTVKSVHTSYVECCATSGHRAAGVSAFRDIWKQCLPHIRFMPSRSDACEQCENGRRKVVGAITEEAKLIATTDLSCHILLAQKEREFYKQKTTEAKRELEVHGAPAAPPHNPCSNNLKKVHYTFDFAQNVSLPHTSRQVGPLYFKSPYKVQLFGVNCEAIPRQVNYLLGEKDTIGEDGKKSHNPNTVVSLLHHFFHFHGQGERECFLHADNCSGQNKNKTVVAYLAWRCLFGLHEKISLSFMIAGHTRCLVDGCFGLLKKKFRRSDCFTMEQLAEVVENSAAPNVAQLAAGSGIIWREWDSFFVKYFRRVPNVSRMHHFEFRSTSVTAKVMFRKSLSDDWQSVELLKTSKQELLKAGLPKVLPASGLSRKRQEYLHSDVRPFVLERYRDVLCPAPDV